MSINATNWVWSLRLGDATRKLILMKYADHAHDDGRNTWVKPSTAAEFAECSERTVQRHLGWVLDEGYMREGDQTAYIWPKSYNGPKDDRYKPIVYDLAMDEETRLQWKAERAEARDGRRDRHAAGGSVRYGRGDNLTPQEASEDAQVSRGDNLTPQRGGPARGDSGSPSEVTFDQGAEHGSEVTLVSPKETVLQPPVVEPSERFPAAADAPTGRLSATVVASTGTPGTEVDLFASDDVIDVEVVDDPEAEQRRIVQTLVAAYAEVVTGKNGGHLTDSQAKAVGANVKRILKNDRIPPEVLLVAVQQAAARGEKSIDRILAAPNGPQASYRRSEAARRAMYDSWLAMGRKLDEARVAKAGVA